MLGGFGGGVCCVPIYDFPFVAFPVRHKVVPSRNNTGYRGARVEIDSWWPAPHRPAAAVRVLDTTRPVYVTGIRISAPWLQYHDERTTGRGPGNSGWFMSANDADVENQQMLVRDRKVAPAQALTIAAAFDGVLTEQLGQPVDVFTKGVEAQNRYGREQAVAAAKQAVALAEQARLRAEALATWDKVDGESLDALREHYDTTDQSFALKQAKPMDPA